MKITLTRPLNAEDPVCDPFNEADSYTPEDESEEDESEELTEFEVRVSRDVTYTESFIYFCEAHDEDDALARAEHYVLRGTDDWHQYDEPFHTSDAEYEVQ